NDMMDDLLSARTVRSLLDKVAPVMGRQNQYHERQRPAPQNSVALADSGPDDARFVRVERASPRGDGRSEALSGLAIVTEDDLGVAPLLVAELRQRGLATFRVSRNDASDRTILSQRLSEWPDVPAFV